MSKIHSFDFEYDYEYNEYSKEGYFARIENIFADDVVKGGMYGKGTYGAIPKLKTADHAVESDIDMSVFAFNDIYDFIWYDLSTVNANRTSGYSNGKPFSLSSWKKRFAYNKTFYAWVKPSGTSATQNVFTFQSVTPDPNDSNLSINEMFSHLAIKDTDKLVYVTESGVEKVTTTNQIVKDEWNLVGIKLFREEGTSTDKCMITLNGETTSSVAR